MLSREEVLHIAELVKLELTDEEIELFKTQLSDILDYISQLEKVDITNIEPTFHVNDVDNVYREDEVKPSLPQADVLKNAYAKEDNFFRLKPVFAEWDN